MKTAVFPPAPPWATRHDSLIPPSLSSTLRKWDAHFLLVSDLAPSPGQDADNERCWRFEAFPAGRDLQKTCWVCEEALWLCKELLQPSPFRVPLICFIKTIVSLQELSEWTHIFSYPVAASLQLGVFSSRSLYLQIRYLSLILSGSLCWTGMFSSCCEFTWSCIPTISSSTAGGWGIPTAASQDPDGGMRRLLLGTVSHRCCTAHGKKRAKFRKLYGEAELVDICDGCI